MIITIFLTIILLISGCTAKNIEILEIQTDSINASTDITQIKFDETNSFNVYIENKSYKKAPFEPDYGVLTGAYIVEDTIINGNINEFENLTKHKNNFYTYMMYMGDEFPINWVLECISKNKIPHIIVYPENTNAPFDYTRAKQFCEDATTLQLPMFIDLYPNPYSFTDNFEEYKKFYKTIREEILLLNPETVFIWTSDIFNGYNNSLYYPGDNFVDWVGINIYMPIYIDNKKNDFDIYKPLEYFYYTYGKNKPIFISQLGFSHYSKSDCAYYETEASKNITNFYENIRINYPQIKAISYTDIDMVSSSPKKVLTDNYSITDTQKVLNSYSEALRYDYFTPVKEIENQKYYFKSPFKAYEMNGNYYISENTAIYDLDIKNIPNNTIKSNENEYINIDNLNILFTRESDNIYI